MAKQKTDSPNDDNTHIGFRVPTSLWTRFRAVSKTRMLTATAQMRVLMLREIEEHERRVAEGQSPGL